ncbi:MAG: tRNA (adenosine(37)-N6)-dimethylallyltransferase MiaA [Ginsengibacter sp.]
MKNKYCFVIVGATAAGKTYFAIQLARHFNTQIISADSRQCYKELNIGVAKPSPHNLEEIKHYFINTHSIQQQVNAKLFETYANDAADIIFKENNVTVMAGGTGLYINAFCNGIDEIPVINEDIKNNIISNFELKGIEWLQNQVKKEDPVYFEKGETKNPQRLMRALEVKRSTGRSITEYQKKQKKEKSFNIIKIGLELPKEQLHKNIDNRVDAMMRQGLLDEVRSLLPYQHLNTLNTVGYRELFTHLNGEDSLNESVDKIKLNTRHYAKRQLTWFKKDKEIKWIDPSTDSESFINTCLAFI